MMSSRASFSIDAPRWDQSTFVGRLKHFFNITDPRTVLVSEQELDRAKALVESCRAGLVPPGTSQEQLFYAKKLYDSAFHPDSGEKMNLIGRMSFQVPGGMAITGFMLQFYRTVPAVVFWQWVNQSFNALVNYTNRNAASPISLTQIGVAYITATSTALATAVGLNLYTKGAHPWDRGDGREGLRAGPFPGGCSQGDYPGGGLQDRHGSAGHGSFADSHGAAGEVPLHEENSGLPCASPSAARRGLPPVHGAGCLLAVPTEMLPGAVYPRAGAPSLHPGQARGQRALRLF